MSDIPTDLDSALKALRRGRIVHVLCDKGKNEENTSRDSARHVLAAETSSPDSVGELLRTGAAPVFVTTRDRLEHLELTGSSCVDDNTDNVRRGDVTLLAQKLARAAAALAGTSSVQAREALQDQPVYPVAWGGLATCQCAPEAAVDLCRLAGLVPAALVSRPRSNDADMDVDCPPSVRIRQILDYRRARLAPSLCRIGPRVRMPTRYGLFRLQAYDDRLTANIHLACWTGEWHEPVLTRVHSECLTGDLLGSLRCDCGPQLQRSLIRLVQEGGGLLLYMRQEGRGIGLINKLRTYRLQEQGFDTVEANEQLGFAPDLRDYSLAAEMIGDLGIRSIRLLTNSPHKVHGLRKHGISVTERVPLIVEPTLENKMYLEVKRKKMGHFL